MRRCSHKNIPQLLHEWFPLAGMSIPYSLSSYSALQFVSACRYCYWKWTLKSSFGILSNSSLTNCVGWAEKCSQASACWGQQMSVNCLAVYIYLYLRCVLYFRCTDGGTLRNCFVYLGRQGYLLLFETKCTSSVLFPTNCCLFCNFIFWVQIMFLCFIKQALKFKYLPQCLKVKRLQIWNISFFFLNLLEKLKITTKCGLTFRHCASCI
jgi:hypothetical protein